MKKMRFSWVKSLISLAALWRNIDATSEKTVFAL